MCHGQRTELPVPLLGVSRDGLPPGSNDPGEPLQIPFSTNFTRQGPGYDDP